MNLKISNDVKNLKISNYAGSKQSKYKIELDCSDGENPYGCSRKVIEALNKVNGKDLQRYSHDMELKETIAKYWNINQKNIALCSGSIEGLTIVNQIFKIKDSKILTTLPHFPDYSNHAEMLGFEHKKVKLLKENNFKYNAEDIINAIDDTISLIYIDTPNNPTGQVLPKKDIIKILECAEEKGIGVLIDEAYGDYMKKEESSIDLTNKYSNLIVLRTFSKGFGLAGIRAGYILTNENICKYINKISNPYCISQVSRKLATESMQDEEFLSNCKIKLADSKQKLRKALPKNIKMAETYDSTSICLLYTDKDIDLCQKLAEKNVKVYSGCSFEGLDKNSIRVNLPSEENIDKLIEKIKSIKI